MRIIKIRNIKSQLMCVVLRNLNMLIFLALSHYHFLITNKEPLLVLLIKNKVEKMQ